MEIDEFMGAKPSVFGQDTNNIEENLLNATRAQEAFQDHPMDDSEEPQPPYKVTISEYEEIANRFEQSLTQLESLSAQLKQEGESGITDKFRQQIERECEKITLRIKFIKYQH